MTSAAAIDVIISSAPISRIKGAKSTGMSCSLETITSPCSATKVRTRSVSEKVLSKLVKHHDILRANYDKRKKQLFYNPNLLDKNLKVEVHNLKTLTKAKQEEEITAISTNYKSNFDIENTDWEWS